MSTSRRSSSDEELMVAYQGGDVRAFEVLLERHQRPVFHFFVRYTGNPAVAEEMTQETFIRLIRSTARYQQKAKFTTWLYTIARNLSIDQSRRARHRKTESLDTPVGKMEDGGPTRLEQTAGPGVGVEREAYGHEFQQALEQALETLSEEQREVFLMREIVQMSFKEIAEVVGAPENTIKSRLRYALEKLREALAAHQPTR